MKLNMLVKASFMTMLFLLISLGNMAQAASYTSLGNGAYTVGKEINAGLNIFSIPEGSATIFISRGDEVFIYEMIAKNTVYYSDKLTASLRAGDEIEIELNYGASPVEVQKLAKVDLKKISVGYYEVGSDIPVGTYSLDIDNPGDEYDTAYFEIYDQYDHLKADFSLYADDHPYDFTFAKGDKIYISLLTGTMSLKGKILVPQSIVLSKSSLSLMVSRTEKVTATIHPSTASNKSVSWTSSNPDIASVDSKGNIKATKAGSTTITATANGDKIVKKSMKVTVTKIVPTSLKLSKTTLNITKNQTVNIVATVTPTDATNKTIVWKSSNTKVATVDSKGKIKGIGNGSATITATTKDNAKVNKTVAVKVSTKTLNVNKTSISLTQGKTEILKTTVSPSDSTDKTVTWKSSNSKIATVDSKGKITGKSKGTATITATVKGANEIKVKVTVTPPVVAKSVKTNKTSASLAKGKTLNLTVTVSPSNVTDKTVKWKSSNTKVATVDSKGKVTAVGAGTAKITATTTNGKSTTTTINVPYVKSLSAGNWKAGADLPAGRYKITTKSGSGNLFIGMGTDRFVNEILSSTDDGFGVTVVTTDIKSGDKIEISGLDSVQFTRVSNVKSNTLHSGYWTVGKDIAAGKYKITTPSGMGNLIIYRGNSLVTNEIPSNKPDYYTVTSVTTTLKSGDRIEIAGLNKVVFTKK